MKAILTGSSPIQLTYTPCLNKFPQDQIQFENDAFHLLLEGYVLNHQSLLEVHAGLELREIILNAYQTGGMGAVLNLLRGSFVLAIEDKASQTTCIANDMLSKRPLFYLVSGDGLMADSSYLSLVADAKAQKFPLTIDSVGVEEMIQRCAFLGGDTYVKEIRFLERFEYLLVTAGGVRVETCEYQSPQEIPQEEDVLIDRMDALFTEACAMAVQKNRTQGYRQVFTLSAGMDSRCAFLKSLPFCSAEEETPLGITYGAAGCMELKIATTLAEKNHCELSLNEIDPASFICDRDTLLDRNEGMMYYAGTTGLSQTLSTLDTDSFGLVITGLGGGEIMGDLGRFGSDEELYRQLFGALISDEAALQTRLDRLQSNAIPYNEYICYQDIRTCSNFAYTSHKLFETFSPFLYEDFFLLLLKVPQESKSFRRLYAKWYLRHIGDPTPTSCFQGPVKVTRRTSPSQLAKGVLRRLRRMLGVQSKWDMNPIGIWVEKHPQNRTYMEETLRSDIAAIAEKHPEWGDRLSQRYLAADADTKLRILTVSGMLKRILSPFSE